MSESRQFPAVTLVLATVLVLLHGVTTYDSTLFNVFVLDRSGIMSGEYWRLLTAHFVHSDSAHATMNVLALLFCCWLLETERGSRPVLFVVVASSLIVSVLILALTGVERYCGFSGVANAIFLVAVAGRGKGFQGILSTVLLLVYLLKLLTDFTVRRAEPYQYAWPVLPEAHLAGMCAGVLIATGLVLSADWTKRNQSVAEICTR